MDRKRLTEIGYRFSMKHTRWKVSRNGTVVATGPLIGKSGTAKARANRKMVAAATVHFVKSRMEPPENKPHLIAMMPRQAGKSALMKWYMQSMDKLIYDQLKLPDIEVSGREYSAGGITLLGELHRGDNRRSDSANPRNALPQAQPQVRRRQGVHHVGHHRTQRRP